jgi:hypothetical protein
MTITTKITELPEIAAANIANTAMLPLVRMDIVETEKGTLGNIGNVILNGAGSAFTRAANANVAFTVANAAQANITSVGTLTALTVSGLITPSQTNGILGTTTNNNVNAGSVGEFLTATVPFGSAVALTTATPTNVTSLSLTAGDWDVEATVGFTGNSATVVTYQLGSIGTTSATITSADQGAFFGIPYNSVAIFSLLSTPAVALSLKRFSLSATTTIYLVVQSGFTVNTQGAYGYIGARRVR